MSAHNLCFHGVIRKIFTWYLILSRPMLVYKIFQRKFEQELWYWQTYWCWRVDHLINLWKKNWINFMTVKSLFKFGIFLGNKHIVGGIVFHKHTFLDFFFFSFLSWWCVLIIQLMELYVHVAAFLIFPSKLISIFSTELYVCTETTL